MKFKNHTLRASQVVLVVKNPPANVGVIRDAGLILGLGQSPGRGHGNPLQYSRWENLMDKGAWWATVHKVAKSWTWLKNTCFDIYLKGLKSSDQNAISRHDLVNKTFPTRPYSCLPDTDGSIYDQITFSIQRPSI